MRMFTDILIGHCIPFTTSFPEQIRVNSRDSSVYYLRNTRELLRRMLQFSVVSAVPQTVFPLSSSEEREGKVYCAFKECI